MKTKTLIIFVLAPCFLTMLACGWASGFLPASFSNGLVTTGILAGVICFLSLLYQFFADRY